MLAAILISSDCKATGRRGDIDRGVGGAFSPIARTRCLTRIGKANFSARKHFTRAYARMNMFMVILLMCVQAEEPGLDVTAK